MPLQNSTPIPVLDLNQKAKTSSRKKASQHNSTPIEEEELQTHYEPLRVDELKKSLLRGGNDEQQNDIKISACRSIGDGPSRAGKRKISWQDQVALRV
uniref:Uncharacterized protein n=1 Tax=Cucumis sativus TaxID=3659 RepID=A0A0A0LTB8_CUCSA